MGSALAHRGPGARLDPPRGKRAEMLILCARIGYDP
jgi:hypothetical protein